MPPTALPSVHPFDRGQWSGRLISVDGTDTTDFNDRPDEPAEVIAAGDTGSGWDGDSAGVARLTDGRFVAWDTNWGPTGDGFYEDAYGGDADIFFGATEEAVVWMGLSAFARTLCGYPAERPEVEPTP